MVIKVGDGSIHDGRVRERAANNVVARSLAARGGDKAGEEQAPRGEGDGVLAHLREE